MNPYGARSPIKMKDWVNSQDCVLAVDPGLSGAVVRIGRGRADLLRDFKKLPDIAKAITALSGGVTRAVMENVHAMPGQGVCSMFSFGRAAGVADGALALSLPHLDVIQVAPQRWQNYIRNLCGLSKEAEFLSPALATALFPKLAPYFTRKKDHNSADAVLIAVWAHDCADKLGLD